MTDDQIELRPANENPWYVLATYHGEQTGDEFDEDLHAKNRKVWNRWVAAAMSGIDRRKLIDDGRATAAELKPFSPEERRELWAGCRYPELPAPDPASSISFNETVFACFVSFDHFIFPSTTRFTRSEFRGNVAFMHASFQEHAIFEYATFQNTADFGHAVFKEFTFFEHAVFEKLTCFEYAVFQKIAIFEHAVFQRIAIFEHAVFEEFAFFEDAVFEGDAIFEHTAFQKNATFMDTAFEKNARFNGSAKRDDAQQFRQFAGSTYYNGATFSGSADFTNREFLDKTHFNNAKFLNQAPVFADTKLHEGTTWHGVQWPGTPDDPLAARNMADAYSHLRRRSNAIQDHEAELDFYGRELRAKRAAVGGATGFLISLYEWSCGFGASVGLPLVWLFGLWASGPPFCRALLRLEGSAEIDGLTLYGFSLASVGGFFGMRKEFFSEFMKDLPGTVLALSGAQSLLGAVFVFLLGLSLRNRFRIK